jgi:hypothetical protein
MNVLNAQEAFSEDVGDINLECHVNHRPFLISRIVFVLRRSEVRKLTSVSSSTVASRATT